MAIGISEGIMIAKLLSTLGQGYMGHRDAARMQREREKAQKEQDRRVGVSNLINAFGGRSTPSPVDYTPSGPGIGSRFFGAIGTAADVAGLYHGATEAKKLQDLQMENVQSQIDARKLTEDITRGTTEGMGSVLPTTGSITPEPLSPPSQATEGALAGRLDPNRFMPKRTIAPSRVSPASMPLGGTVPSAGLSDVGQAAFRAAQTERMATSAAARTAVQQQAFENQMKLTDMMFKESDLDLRTRIFNDKINNLGKLSLKDRLAAEKTLRTDFNKLTADFRSVGDSFNTILAGADDPTAASDLSLIFAFMKMLDPRSTVRESEFAQAEQSGALPDRVQNIVGRFWDGQRLTVNRKDFLSQAKNLYDARLPGYTTLVEKYGSIAGREGLDVRNVLTDYRVNLDRFNKVMGSQMPNVGISGGVDLDLIRNWNKLAPGQGVLRQ